MMMMMMIMMMMIIIIIIIIIIMATRLRAGRWGLYGSIRGGGCEFSSPQRPERLCGSPSLLSNGYQGLFPWG
jgi:hypothetical protein